ncbi:hypothetical protein HDV00_004790 [Rhizophlyctis rosea]|nr:hypothetical protein HDV00_004790 [Rhizophlyctis rosea]
MKPNPLMITGLLALSAHTLAYPLSNSRISQLNRNNPKCSSWCTNDDCRRFCAGGGSKWLSDVDSEPQPQPQPQPQPEPQPQPNFTETEPEPQPDDPQTGVASFRTTSSLRKPRPKWLSDEMREWQEQHPEPQPQPEPKPEPQPEPQPQPEFTEPEPEPQPDDPQTGVASFRSFSPIHLRQALSASSSTCEADCDAKYNECMQQFWSFPEIRCESERRQCKDLNCSGNWSDWDDLVSGQQQPQQQPNSQGGAASFHTFSPTGLRQALSPSSPTCEADCDKKYAECMAGFWAFPESSCEPARQQCKEINCSGNWSDWDDLVSEQQQQHQRQQQQPQRQPNPQSAVSSVRTFSPTHLRQALSPLSPTCIADCESKYNSCMKKRPKIPEFQCEFDRDQCIDIDCSFGWIEVEPDQEPPEQQPNAQPAVASIRAFSAPHLRQSPYKQCSRSCSAEADECDYYNFKFYWKPQKDCQKRKDECIEFKCTELEKSQPEQPEQPDQHSPDQSSTTQSLRRPRTAGVRFSAATDTDPESQPESQPEEPQPDPQPQPEPQTPQPNNYPEYDGFRNPDPTDPRACYFKCIRAVSKCQNDGKLAWGDCGTEGECMSRCKYDWFS